MSLPFDRGNLTLSPFFIFFAKQISVYLLKYRPFLLLPSLDSFLVCFLLLNWSQISQESLRAK